MQIIELQENGAKVKKSVIVDKIKSFEPLKYSNGIDVTIVEFTDGTEIHVVESVKQIKQLLSSL